MLYIVTGGSGSGKSAFAEDLAVKLHNESLGGGLYYIATMHPYDEESVLRIKRHRNMRRGKGFVTIEQELFLGNDMEDILSTLEVPGTYLLEDLSNLLANEMYIGNYKEMFLINEEDIRRKKPQGIVEENNKKGVEMLLKKMKSLCETAANVVIVTNEIFSDHFDYDSETVSFMKQLAYLNCQLVKEAGGVAEVVCGIPIWQKGGKEC